MDSHLSEIKIRELLNGNVAGRELLALDAHIAECAECAERIAEAVAGRAAVIGEEPSVHLEYETLEAYVESALNDVELEIADVHLRVCEECREDLEDLKALKAELEAPGEALDSRTPIPGGAGMAGFWKILVPAFGVAAIAILLGVWYSRSGREIVDANPSPIPTPSAVLSPVPTSESATPEPEETPSPEPELRVSLNDGSETIGLAQDGSIKGIGGTAFDRAVRKALNEGRVDVDRSSLSLKQGSGELMGPGSGVPFALGSPVGIAVESNRPSFRWSKLADADNYRVEVYDEAFNRVAQSPVLKTNSWTPSDPLPRGKSFRWQVTASKGDKEVKSPIRPAPDARFTVISSASAAEISAARRTNGTSHLVMGIAYAKAGLLSKAEREFKALVRQNPSSPIAKRLLAQVRSRR